jgi:glutamine amidotransferase
MITIIDYGAGNLASIRNMLRTLDVDSQVTGDPEEIRKAEKLILPGVGAFDHGMSNLNRLGLVDVLHEKVLTERTPILGICLGVQLFTKRSDEGELAGLGWVDAETVRFEKTALSAHERIPHMGWCEVEENIPCKLFQNMPAEPRFYFVHSYHLKCNHVDDAKLAASYGYSFTSGIEKDNIFGVQFHPEKSHRFGKQLLANYAAVN